MTAAKKKTVQNVRVRLLAAHFIDGVVHKKGAIIKNYSGALSQNMKELPKTSASGAEDKNGSAGGTADPATGD